MAVNKKFAAAGLEIAFSQTDIHVRTVPKEWLRGGGPAPTNGTANGKESTSGKGELREH